MPSWNNRAEQEALADEILKPVDHAEFAKKIADKRFTYYVSYAVRPGFRAFSGLVEYTMFHPSIPECHTNDDFLFMIVDFDGAEFIVFGVPVEFEERVARLAEIIQLRIVTDAYPAMVGSEGVKMFPGVAEAKEGRPNLYSIENVTGSQVYLNRRDLSEALFEREKELVDCLMKFGPQLGPQEVSDYLWTGMLPGKRNDA